MSHPQWFGRESQMLSHKLKFQMESVVRETFPSILSLSSFTRLVKAVHQTHSFTRSVYVVCTLIKDFVVFHCLYEIIIQNWIRFNSSGNFKVGPSYCHARLREGTKQELNKLIHMQTFWSSTQAKNKI